VFTAKQCITLLTLGATAAGQPFRVCYSLFQNTPPPPPPRAPPCSDLQALAFAGGLVQRFPWIRDRMIFDDKYLFKVLAECVIDCGASCLPMWVVKVGCVFSCGRTVIHSSRSSSRNVAEGQSTSYAVCTHDIARNARTSVLQPVTLFLVSGGGLVGGHSTRQNAMACGQHAPGMQGHQLWRDWNSAQRMPATVWQVNCHTLLTSFAATHWQQASKQGSTWIFVLPVCQTVVLGRHPCILLCC
jgi:hypothetical protein